MTEEFDFDTFGDADDVQEVKETEELTLEPVITETTEPVQTLELEPEAVAPEPEMELVLEPAPPLEVEATSVELPAETGLALTSKPETFALQDSLILPSKREVDAKYEILEYIKKKVVSSKEDYQDINGKPYLLASGTAKFINYFKLKVTYPSREIINDDYGQHCEFICRVEAPWGQIVDSYGNASMLTMKLKKTRHNMVALAETRARTRAVRIIMGFKEPSYAEMHGNTKL